MAEGPILKPGVETSEYAVSRTGSTFGIIVSICGAILAVIPEILSTANEIPAVANSRYGKLIVQILGAVMTIAGVIVKMSNDHAWIEGRNLVKAAAARDVPPPPVI